MLHINNVTKGQNSWRYLGSVLWNNLLSEIRNNKTLYSFKIKLKSCRLRKVYANGVGFLNNIT